MSQKILVAMDESDNALRAVDFVGNNLKPDASVTLFSVLLDTAAMCNMQGPGLTPYFVSQQSSFCSLEDKKKEIVQQAQKKAKETLVQHGFNAGNIETRVIVREKGIARDIIREAKKGEYDLVVLGKQGLSGIKDFLLGSIAQKVINGTEGMSVLLVN
ncbi:MAG: universal stress protein [Desulfosudaceae bacterium]